MLQGPEAYTQRRRQRVATAENLAPGFPFSPMPWSATSAFHSLRQYHSPIDIFKEKDMSMRRRNDGGRKVARRRLGVRHFPSLLSLWRMTSKQYNEGESYWEIQKSSNLYSEKL
jgi:hypothetical protein